MRHTPGETKHSTELEVRADVLAILDAQNKDVHDVKPLPEHWPQIIFAVLDASAFQELFYAVLRKTGVALVMCLPWECYRKCEMAMETKEFTPDIFSPYLPTCRFYRKEQCSFWEPDYLTSKHQVYVEVHLFTQPSHVVGCYRSATARLSAVCRNCHACEGHVKSRCSVCEVVYYCDEECQRQDWQYHRATCGEQKKALDLMVSHVKQDTAK